MSEMRVRFLKDCMLPAPFPATAGASVAMHRVRTAARGTSVAGARQACDRIGLHDASTGLRAYPCTVLNAECSALCIGALVCAELSRTEVVRPAGRIWPAMSIGHAQWCMSRSRPLHKAPCTQHCSTQR
jgi:hypothetical protein